MGNPEAACNRMDPAIRSCAGCNVPALLWRLAETKQVVKRTAEEISAKYCPEGSGGIDEVTMNTVYNYKPDADVKRSQSIW